MSAKEYTLWLADHDIEPWGEIKADYRAAMICKMSLMPHVEQDFDLEEFIVKLETVESKPESKQTPEEVFTMFKNYTLAMGGKVT